MTTLLRAGGGASFYELEELFDEPAPEASSVLSPDSREKLLDASLHELPKLSFRTASALENDKGNPNRLGEVRQVRTVRELLALRPEDILAIPNLGEKTLTEIYTCLARCGFVRKGFVVRESPEDRRERSDRQRRDQLKRRLGYHSGAAS